MRTTARGRDAGPTDGDLRGPGSPGRRRAFWASASVLALALWASGSPSVLYPIYAHQWGLSPLVVTSVFATYQLTLIVVLPLLGNLSDRFGRRLVMVAGVALIGASAVVFAVAPNVGFLYLGRVLQGGGAGLAMGAATASMLENNTSRSPRFASVAATVATSAGLTSALLISGVFAEYLPLPLVWSYIVLLILTVSSAAALLLSPDDRPNDRQRWRPRAPFVPSGIRLGFLAATLSVALAYCLGAVFLSLGAHMIDEFTHTDNTLIVGALLAASSAPIGIAGLFLSRFRATGLIVAGAALTLVSLALMSVATARQSMTLFLGWCVVGGVAYSLAFTGGLGLVNGIAPDRHRGATLSLLYLLVYVLQAGTALGIGALATTNTLRTAVDVTAVALGVLCAVVVVLATVQGARVRHAVS